MNSKKLSKFTLEKFLDVCDDIFYELELIEDNSITIPCCPPACRYPSLEPGNSLDIYVQHKNYRYQILKILKDKNIIMDYEFYGCDELGGSTSIDIKVNRKNFENFYKQIKKQYDTIKTKEEKNIQNELGKTCEKINLQQSEIKQSNVKKKIKLTKIQEKEFKFYQYKSRLPIHITGEIPKPRTNKILVDNMEVIIQDSSFQIFLRMVVELFRGKGGSISIQQLEHEGHLSKDGEEQAIKRLRKCFENALKNLKPTKFIETYETKTRRISTHPAFITYNKKKLLQHSYSEIAKIAKNLP